MEITFRKSGVHTSVGKAYKGDILDLPEEEAELYISRDWALNGSHPDKYEADDLNESPPILTKKSKKGKKKKDEKD